MKITLAQRAVPAEDVLFQEVGGEAVLLSLSSESYFGLDAVGTRIWHLLGNEPDLNRAFEVLCMEFDAEPARLQADLVALVGKLAEAGLVRIA